MGDCRRDDKGYWTGVAWLGLGLRFGFGLGLGLGLALALTLTRWPTSQP